MAVPDDPSRRAGIDMIPLSEDEQESLSFTPLLAPAEESLYRSLAQERAATRRQAQHAFDILLSIVLDTHGSAKLDVERLHQEFWASAGPVLREYRTMVQRRADATRDVCGND